jgi:Protein of unknown function (DUF3300)
VNRSKRISFALLSFYLVFATIPGRLAYAADESPQIPVAYAQPTPQQLQQLVAPIALYPDSLVVQILAGTLCNEA